MIFWLCFICHVFADFWFQGGCHLHEFKQKSWWDNLFSSVELREPIGNRTIEEQTADNQARRKKYAHDWMAALFIHAFSWSVITFFPLLVVFHSKLGYAKWGVTVIVSVNAAIHFVIDHAKCNAKSINLVQDQILHLLQIFTTILVTIACVGD